MLFSKIFYYSLVSELDRECGLSSKAHLLLAVNDEAAADLRTRPRPGSAAQPPAPPPAPPTRHRHSHHVANNDRQHWLLG